MTGFFRFFLYFTILQEQEVEKVGTGTKFFFTLNKIDLLVLQTAQRGFWLEKITTTLLKNMGIVSLLDSIRVF